jgi:uncharacterized membrane protein
MPGITESIDVRVPVRVAYNQWTQFEEFPAFMEGIKAVRQLDDRRLMWRVDIGGREKEWVAEIVQQIPDERIHWRSTEGAENAGVVTFQAVDDETTRITLRIDYDPEGMIEHAGDALGVVHTRVRGDLWRFKEFIENIRQETGAWRGRIPPTPHKGIAGPPDPDRPLR